MTTSTGGAKPDAASERPEEGEGEGVHEGERERKIEWCWDGDRQERERERERKKKKEEGGARKLVGAETQDVPRGGERGDGHRNLRLPAFEAAVRHSVLSTSSC